MGSSALLHALASTHIILSLLGDFAIWSGGSRFLRQLNYQPNFANKNESWVQVHNWRVFGDFDWSWRHHEFSFHKWEYFNNLFHSSLSVGFRLWIFIPQHEIYVFDWCLHHSYGDVHNLSWSDVEN